MTDAMTEQVFVWTSYSCNNSSDFRLVAEFATPAQAAAMAAELAAFFAAHAKEYDARSLDETADDWPGKPTQTAIAYGEKYGHKWREYLIWGDEQLTGDEPAVAALGSHVVLYHTYFSDAFGPDLPKVLGKAGAKLTEKRAQDGPPVIHGEFELPAGKPGERLAAQLAEFFAQRDAAEPHDFDPPRGMKFKQRGAVDEYAYCRDGAQIAFTWPLDPSALPAVEQHLEKAGARKLTLRLAGAREPAELLRRAEKLELAAQKLAYQEGAKRAKPIAPAVPAAPVPAPPSELPAATLVTKLSGDYFETYCGAGADGETLYVVGGLSVDHALRSDDGMRFTKLDCKPIDRKYGGLRGVAFDGKAVWICGEYGSIGATTRDFSTIAEVTSGTDSCLYHIARADDGALWFGGDKGYLVRMVGKQLERIRGVTGKTEKIRATPLGLLLPATSGLYVASGKRVKKLGLAKPVNDVAVTPAGTIVAVGVKNSAFRSTDGGKTFRPAKLPAFKQAKGKHLERPYWVDTTTDLMTVAVLPDGRVVIGGDQGVILASCDDGATFRTVPHQIFDGGLYGSAVFRAAVYLVGANNAVIRVT